MKKITWNQTLVIAAAIFIGLATLVGAQGLPVGNYVTITGSTSPPAPPPPGQLRLYSTTANSHLLSMNSSGTSQDISAGAAGSGYSTVQSAGTAVTARPTINFVSGTTCVDNSGANRTDCTTTNASYYQTVEDEGTAVTQQPALNFTGDGISCSDDATNHRSICNVPGASIPSGQIAYGTGSGVTSSSEFYVIPTTGTLVTGRVSGNSSYLSLVNDNTADVDAGTSFASSIELTPTQGILVTPSSAGAFSFLGSTGVGRLCLPTNNGSYFDGCFRSYNGALQFSVDGTSTWTDVGSGGGGTIGGSIASGQIPVGSGTNTVGGSANLTADTSGNLVAAGSVTTPTITNSGVLTLSSNGNTLNFDGATNYLTVPGGVMGIGTHGLTSSWSGLYIAGATTQIGSNGAVALKTDGTQISPGSDLTTTFGSSSARATESWFRRRGGVEQIINAAPTITLDPALGETAIVYLGSTAITAVDGVAGYPDETLTTLICEDATGSRSIGGWASGTNGFRLAGGSYTPTTGANKCDSISWKWSAALAKWLETSRAMDL